MVPWLSVLTNPARPQYLQRTLDELDREGAAQLAREEGLLRWIAVDGDPDLVPDRPGWVKGKVGDDSGTRRSLLRIMHGAADGNAAHLLYFEDDLIACRNAVLGLHRTFVPDECGFATSFIMRNDLRKGGEIRTSHQLPGGFWGTQALKVPARSLRHLRKKTIQPWDIKHSGDVWLGENLAGQNAPTWKFLIIRPSLFDHVGLISRAHPGDKERRAWDFSRDFDALSIVR